MVNGIPVSMTFEMWVMHRLPSIYSIMELLSGLLIFVGASYFVATRKRVAVLAAYIFLLPLPILISIFGSIVAWMWSFYVIWATGPTLKAQDFAECVAISLLDLGFAVAVSGPSYLVVAIGLLARTLNSEDQSSVSRCDQYAQA